MEIYKVIADERPKECMLCPINFGHAQSTMHCGQRIMRDIGGGWTEELRVPNESCLFEVEQH